MPISSVIRDAGRAPLRGGLSVVISNPLTSGALQESVHQLLTLELVIYISNSKIKPDLVSFA